MKDIVIENITLKMWEKSMMSESIFSEEKKQYVKTGKKVEQTTYSFLDEDGDKLVFLSDKNEWRKMEGQTGDLHVSLNHDNFNKVNKIQFKGFVVR